LMSYLFNDIVKSVAQDLLEKIIICWKLDENK